jgi:hypothetical protein
MHQGVRMTDITKTKAIIIKKAMRREELSIYNIDHSSFLIEQSAVELEGVETKVQSTIIQVNIKLKLQKVTE